MWNFICLCMLYGLVAPLQAVAQGGASPQMYAGIVEGVGDGWQTVSVPGNYQEMIVVGVPQYRGGELPAVVRIRNANGSSFQVRVQNPSGQPLSGFTVHFVVVEAGVYTLNEHGIKMEASTLETTAADHASSWLGQRVQYANDYANPVVLGQVLTARDDRWSVFWARGSLISSPPGEVALIGKHVGEDTDLERASEVVGYMVIESSSGEIPGYLYHAYVGEDIVSGVDNNPPFMYSHDLNEATVGILSVAGVDGANGGWPVLWGDNVVSNRDLALAFDEDQVRDPERNHTTEQVAALVLEPFQRFPAVKAFQPASGPAGSEVTIAGEFLTTVDRILLNDIPVEIVGVVNENEISIKVPDGAETGAIRIIGPQGFETTTERAFVVTFDVAEAGMNLCRLTGAAISQSSLASGLSGPQNACDGVLEGTLAEETISATRSESESWWEVDLGALYRIDEVRIWNRSECCQDDLSNFFLFLSENPFISKSVQLTLADPAVGAYLIGDVGMQTQVAVNRAGRYVRVQHTGAKPLGMAEVEIIATDGQVIPVSIEEDAIQPGKSVLSPVFPSPAANEAVISYSLEAAGEVRLVVYDMLGREVDQLVDRYQNAGLHRVHYSTSHLPGGHYIIRLRSGEHTMGRVFSIVR